MKKPNKTWLRNASPAMAARALLSRLPANHSSPRGTRAGKTGSAGAVIVFVLLVLIPLIGLIGLVIDIGRIHYIKRQLQNGADFAATAGATMLHKCDPSLPCSVPSDPVSCAPREKPSRGGWAAVKPAALVALAKNSFTGTDVSGLVAEGPPLTFPQTWDTPKYSSADVFATLNDPDGFGSTRLGKQTGAGLTVEVYRWFQCKQGNHRRIIQIDPMPVQVVQEIGLKVAAGHSINYATEYCYANTVTVRLTHPGLPLYFVRIFEGWPADPTTPAITKTASALVRNPTCDTLPDCHVFIGGCPIPVVGHAPGSHPACGQ